MAIILDEHRLVDDTIFKYEERLNTQISRFLDKSPVFTEYYHINANETTVDSGYKDVEEVIGERSPIRYQKINDFPIYGLDAIILAINESEEGLNTEYSGEAVILPNTIRPLQDDFFIIKHVKGPYLFRVTGIEYDNIRPDNYYKISFKFEYLDDEMVRLLNNQVNETFTCILQNVGTENNCLIEETYFEKLKEIEDMYNEMVNTYKVIFYSNRHNCFLGDFGEGKIFDPLMSVFINKHKLLNRKNDLSTILLSDGFEDPKRKIKYEKSIYRFFERRDAKTSKPFNYMLLPSTSKHDSSFYRWNEDAISIVEIPTNMEGTYNILPLDIANIFKLNGPTESPYIDMMRRFIRNEEFTIHDIPGDLNEVLLSLDANEEFFFFTPILMYIIQTVVNDFLKTK